MTSQIVERRVHRKGATRGGIAVVHSLGPDSEFARKAKQAGAKKMQAKLIKLANQAAIETNAIVAQDYHTRIGKRRHLEGPHLIGSFYGTVMPPVGNAAVFATIKVQSHASAKKVAILTYGAGAHKITAKNASKLVFPRTDKNPFANQAKYIRNPYGADNAKDGKPTRGVKAVNHPGVRPNDFMIRGMDEAARKVLGVTVAAKLRVKARQRV